jgi:hypothetical protein
MITQEVQILLKLVYIFLMAIGIFFFETHTTGTPPERLNITTPLHCCADQSESKKASSINT